MDNRSARFTDMTLLPPIEQIAKFVLDFSQDGRERLDCRVVVPNAACVLKEPVDIIRDDDPQTLQPNAAAVARKVNDGVGTCEWRHGARWGGGDRLVQQMVVDSPVLTPSWETVLEGKERDRSEERSVIEELSGQHPSTRDREKLTSAASGLPNCTSPTCPPNHRCLDRYTVSSVALIASTGVVGVVETGRLGAVSITRIRIGAPRRPTEERKGGEDKSIAEIRIGKKDDDGRGDQQADRRYGQCCLR
ncbi:hypothetical protein EDB84DRAFT_1444637 [Lactarius hengduanensis]|nr:hypothetical protein EDB84DRAFT_1444637 [Lactarius hengduanensis]